jgi:hypothetical protein
MLDLLLVLLENLVMNSPPDASAATAEIAQELTPALQPQTWREKLSNLRNVGTGLVLGGIAVADTIAEATGSDISEIPVQVSSSLRHPILGFAGAWAAEQLCKDESKWTRRAGVLVFASAVNFAAETIQSYTVAAPQYVDFLSTRNLPETAKDYAFSLVGMGIYMLQNRRKANTGQPGSAPA